MRRRKVYGESRIDACPFCGKTCTAENSQGVPVCSSHKSQTLNELKCICGDWIDLMKGKYGPYGRCFNCGNVSFAKILELNPVKPPERKEITVSSDEVDFI